MLQMLGLKYSTVLTKEEQTQWHEPVDLAQVDSMNCTKDLVKVTRKSDLTEDDILHSSADTKGGK